MSQNKKSYFQGTEEPTPKKKKYKSEKSVLEQTRFKEPLYRNYDPYNISDNGPGAGWHEILKYKSISDFLSNKRKKRTNKMKARAKLFVKLIKIAIDFPIDDQISSGPILGDSGTYSDSVPIGGMLDEYLTESDEDNKSVDKLNFGRDYDEDKCNIDTSMQELLNSRETDLYGLPDGVDPEEDLDADKTLSQYNYNKEFGTNIYSNM